MDQDTKRIEISATHHGNQLVFPVGIIIAILLLSSDRSIAGTYSRTDKSGMFHIVDDLSKVPPEYRKKNVDDSDGSSTPSARIRNQDGQEKYHAPSGSSDVSGSWIEKEDPYEFKKESLVIHLNPDGTGYGFRKEVSHEKTHTMA